MSILEAKAMERRAEKHKRHELARHPEQKKI